MPQVVSLRLPAEFVARFLPQILEGILLWAEDSKNKFRAKVGREMARQYRGGCCFVLRLQAPLTPTQMLFNPPRISLPRRPFLPAGALDCGEAGQAVRVRGGGAAHA